MKTTAINLPETETQNLNLFDFVTIFYIIGLLLIDFLPDFGSQDIIAPQYLYICLLNIGIGIFIYKNPMLLSDRIRALFKSNYIFKAYPCFLFLCGISVFAAKNFSLWVVNFSYLVTSFCLFINLVILLFDRKKLFYTVVLIVGFSAFFQTFFQILDFIQISKSGTIENALRTFKGNTGNVNVFAASVNIKIPFILIGIIHFSNWKKWFLYSTFFFSALSIFLTGARSSYIGLLIMIICFIIGYLKIYAPSIKNISNSALLIILLIPAFFIANTIFDSSKSTERYKSVTGRFSEINTEEASASSRLKFWDIGYQITKSKPILGIGIGNWRVESIPYERTILDDSQISVHPHNDFIEIFAETGILNGLIYLSLFLFIFYSNINAVLKSEDTLVQTIALLSFLIIVAYSIDALLNFPLYRTTMQLFLCFCFAFTVINTLKDTDLKPMRLFSVTPIILLLIGISSLYFLFVNYRTLKFERNLRADTALDGDYIMKNLPDYPNVNWGSESYLMNAGVRYYKEENYEKAIKCFDEALKINSYMGHVEWYKYKIALLKKEIDSSYLYSKKAFYLRPRNSSFFISATYAAQEKKDAAGVLKIHEEYSKYKNSPQNFITTSKALYHSKYDNSKNISFIDKGLVAFPNDTSLIKRKKWLEKVSTGYIAAKEVQKQQTTAKENSTLKINYLEEALKFGEKQRFDKSLENYKLALKQYPDNKTIIQNIGICYFKLNNFKAAISHLKNALNDPQSNDGKTEYLLGISYLNTYDNDNGCKFLNIAKSKNYPNASQLVEQHCK